MKVNHTPNFLKSKTEMGLKRLMLQNNIKRKAWHLYSIIWNGKEYVAWYYIDITDMSNMTEVIDDTVKV
jgi:hypothetical protein